ncbi:MAG: hypothetical protein JW814_12360 [Candidatus Krumholzibacteriota bacterium]|nr:hypothetical protein [Candidatus Krumholzibacteriota bacterium]
MRLLKNIIIIICLTLCAMVVQRDTLEAQEYNIKEIMKKEAAAIDQKEQLGEDILQQMQDIIADLDSLISFRNLKNPERWAGNIFRPRFSLFINTIDSSRPNEKKDRGEPDLVLTGTLIGNGRAIAIFGTREVKVGDVIDGLTVSRIETGIVVLEGKNGLLTIRM